ncbi:helix-turn-helix domain-containing protein [Streptomyces sp. NPDC052225]|uniref:helix-turn-helix domain-containing protein n=1 Tax=Streptomyces sp. NPDC052225 TaxID=3154949 RepID=UPI00343B1C27
MAEFCEQLRLLVRDSGLAQSQLAARIGKSEPAVSELLNGRRTRPPAWDDVRRIVDSCGVAKGLDGRARAVETEAWRHRHGELVGVYEKVRELEPAVGAQPAPAVSFRVDPRDLSTVGQLGWAQCLGLLVEAGDHPAGPVEALRTASPADFRARLYAVCADVLDSFPARVRETERITRTAVCQAVLPVARMAALLEPEPAPPERELSARTRRAMVGFAEDVRAGVSATRVAGSDWVWDIAAKGRLWLAEPSAGDLDRAALHFDRIITELAAVEPELWLRLEWWDRLPEAAGTALDALVGALTSPPVPLPFASDAARTIARGPEGTLDRPLVEGYRGGQGPTLPRLGEAYVDPVARRAVLDAGLPAHDDAWWAEQDGDAPLGALLAAHFSGAQAVCGPLLVLGHPGVGKSVLTRVLAARLPDGFLPVRVELRAVPADAPVQEQIERALAAQLGEPLTWPALVRGAPGRLPVVLLDGFDELVQAAERSHWDYLEQVERFQAREAAAGRPLAVVVTSRTVVAHRSRIPDGTRGLYLEAFDAARRERWLATWNTVNQAYFAAHGLRPLAADVVEDHAELACQPILLLLLALYDSVDNGLARATRSEVSGAVLYEEMLLGFLRRQVRKQYPHAEPETVEADAQAELRRLGVVALAMFNRGRQSVRAAQVVEDARALLGPDHGWDGDRAFGRFFFIHEAQAMMRGESLRAYEFLHGTFSEYLVARTIWRTALAVRAAEDAAELRALLSYAQLTERGQVLTRLGELRAAAAPEEVRGLAGVLPLLLDDALNGAVTPVLQGYEPRTVRPLTRLAQYSANLALLSLLIGPDEVPVSELLHATDGLEAWRRITGLWESQLPDENWNDLTWRIELRRTPGKEPHVGRDLGPADPLVPVVRTIGAGDLLRRARFGCRDDTDELLRGPAMMPVPEGREWWEDADAAPEGADVPALVHLLTANPGPGVPPRSYERCLAALDRMPPGSARDAVLWSVTAALTRDLPGLSSAAAGDLIAGLISRARRHDADSEAYDPLVAAVETLATKADAEPEVVGRLRARLQRALEGRLRPRPSAT